MSPPPPARLFLFIFERNHSCTVGSFGHPSMCACVCACVHVYMWTSGCPAVALSVCPCLSLSLARFRPQRLLHSMMPLLEEKKIQHKRRQKHAQASIDREDQTGNRSRMERGQPRPSVQSHARGCIASRRDCLMTGALLTSPSAHPKFSRRRGTRPASRSVSLAFSTLLRSGWVYR